MFRCSKRDIKNTYLDIIWAITDSMHELYDGSITLLKNIKMQKWKSYDWSVLNVDLTFFEFRLNVGLTIVDKSEIKINKISESSQIENVLCNSGCNQVLLEAYIYHVTEYIKYLSEYDEIARNNISNFIGYLSTFERKNENKIIYLGESLSLVDLISVLF
jgi:hypothetical protein